MTFSRLPLAGMRVVDFSSLLPGPAATQNLVALGGEVIKVEPPGGDPSRSLYGGAVFDHFNQGKRSLVLDLKDGGQRATAQQLCGSADVVVESYRGGVAERLGIGEPQLRAANPRLIYCAIKGFEAGGPRASWGAHDLNLLALSGALAQPGSWSARSLPPVRPSIPLVDLATAAVATQAILAALLARSSEGAGAFLEISMFEVISQWAASRIPAGEAGRVSQPQNEYLDPANDIYATEDARYLTVSAIEAKSWRALCELLSQVEPRIGEMKSLTPAERRERGDEVQNLLAKAFRMDTADVWVNRIRDAQIPAECVAAPGNSLSDPWLLGRGAVVEGRAQVPLPFGSPLPAPPRLDEMKDEIGLPETQNDPGES